MRFLAALAFIVAASPAWAGSSLPPVVVGTTSGTLAAGNDSRIVGALQAVSAQAILNYGPTNSAGFLAPRQAQALAPLTMTGTVQQLANTWTDIEAGTDCQSGTHQCEFVIEGPDSPWSGVRLKFASGTTTWNIDQVVATPSATYGPSAYTAPGISAYDEQLNIITSMQSVTFNNAGSVLPWFPGQQVFTGSATSGGGSLSLALTAAAASGATTLTFPTLLITNNLQGGVQPIVGMYMWDGTGAIPSGTKLTGYVGATGVASISAALTAAIPSGNSIYFGWYPGVISAVVPASTNSPSIQPIASDPIQMESVPRTDTPCVGETISSPASSLFPSGDLITSVAFNSFGVSIPTGVAGVFNTELDFTQLTTATSVVNTGWFKIPVASTSCLMEGSSVTGTNIPSGDYVTQVGNGYVRINAPTTGAITSGASLSFGMKSWLDVSSATLPVGSATIPVESTSRRRLLLVRMTAHGTNLHSYTYGASYPSSPLVTQYNYNLMLGYQSSASADGINNTALVGRLAGSPGTYGNMPIFGIDFLMDRPGMTVCGAGDSHLAGNTTLNGGNASYIDLATMSLSTPAVPVNYVNLGASGLSSMVYVDQLMHQITQNKCNLVVLAGWTSNDGGIVSPQEYQYVIRSIQDYIITTSPSTKLLVVSELPRQGREENVFLANGTQANVRTGVVHGYFDYQFGGTYHVEGAGIPAGTTATVVVGTNTFAFSQSVTLTDGQTIYLGRAVVQAASTGTTIAVGNPFPVNNSGLTLYDNGVAVPSVTATITTSSSTVTLTGAVTVAAGDVLSFGQTQPATGATGIQYAQQTIAWQNMLASRGSDISFFDAYTLGEDPNDLGFWRPGYSADAIHGSDAFMQAIYPTFAAVERQLLGL